MSLLVDEIVQFFEEIDRHIDNSEYDEAEEQNRHKPFDEVFIVYAPYHVRG
jgi:hypothetical protein